VDMHATDLVGINGITRVLLLYTCQQGVYPRGHVLPLRLPLDLISLVGLMLSEQYSILCASAAEVSWLAVARTRPLRGAS
jgi:hypothetical protein